MSTKKRTVEKSIEELARAMKHGFGKASTKQDLEELAQAVKRGFDETATKQDLTALATKEQLQLVVDNLDLARADIHDIKITLGPLVRTVAALDSEVVGLRRRMERVEKRIGIVR